MSADLREQELGSDWFVLNLGREEKTILAISGVRWWRVAAITGLVGFAVLGGGANAANWMLSDQTRIDGLVSGCQVQQKIVDCTFNELGVFHLVGEV